VPGKVDWLARGLPSEGTKADEPTAGKLARRDAPTCGLDERVGDVRKRLGTFARCVVLGERNVVAGVLASEQLAAPDETRAEDAMRPGPSTFRPNVPIREMAEFFEKNDLPSVPITSVDGTLIGVLLREDALGS
jgi:Mg/Co/Ni transporter MgtE